LGSNFLLLLLVRLGDYGTSVEALLVRGLEFLARLVEFSFALLVSLVLSFEIVVGHGKRIGIGKNGVKRETKGR